MPSIGVIGGGAHAKVCISTLRAAGYKVKAVYDDAPEKHGTELLGVAIKGPCEQAAKDGRPAVLAIGDNRVRKRFAKELDLEWVSAVHPRAIVDDSVKVGPGTLVFAGCVVQPDTQLGAHVIVNTGAVVDHDCVVEDFVHLGPGSSLCGAVQVGKGALVGVGACARPGITIGKWSVVGAGAAVVSDVPAQALSVGVPAKIKGGD